MQRLFIGLELAEDVKTALLQLQGGIKGARWQTKDQLHLTLRFIGDVDSPTACDISAALNTLHFTAFEVTIKGVGHFGKPGFMRALWAGVSPLEPLESLHKKLDRSLIQLGMDAEKRRFKPHITLARFNKSPRRGEVEEFMHRNGLVHYPPFTITYNHSVS